MRERFIDLPMDTQHGQDALLSSSLFDQKDLLGFQPIQRRLGGENDHYLEADKDGKEYDPYSLSWRYLGLFIDCDIEAMNAAAGDDARKKQRRQLPEDEEDGNNCPRKLLWAAYVDQGYEGNTIEEYKFYDIPTGEWDNSTCLASGEEHRCVNLDCHDPSTGNFTLVGVFQETDGVYDFFEQLFKHEGICLWNDDDVFDTMTTWMEEWPEECEKLDLSDDDGNTLYMSTAPLPEGNMTLGVYVDNSCTQLSSIDYTGYIARLYQSYYEESDHYGYEYYQQYYYNQGQQKIQEFNATIETWNEYMSSFKICQPCRAYNLQQQQKRGDKHERRNNNRLLNDGDGEEQERYNCEDKAGYTNVNQCYKFESKTRMALATSEELARASEQGSILFIEAYDSVYGKGGYYVSVSALPEWEMQNIYTPLAALLICSVAICVGCVARFCCRARKGKVDTTERSLGETFCEEDSDLDGKEHVKASPSMAKSGAGTPARWKNKFSKKNKLNDIESGAYNPPTSPLLPPRKDGGSIEATSGLNSVEIEKSQNLQTNVQTSNPGEDNKLTESLHAECTDGTFAEKDNARTRSLVSDHDSTIVLEHTEEVKLEAHLERSEESINPSDNTTVANSKKEDSPAVKKRIWKRIYKRLSLA